MEVADSDNFVSFCHLSAILASFTPLHGKGIGIVTFLHLLTSLLAALHVPRLTIPILDIIELNSMCFPRIQDA